MIEATTNAATRNAIHKAHRERGAAINAFWGWLFPRFAR